MTISNHSPGRLLLLTFVLISASSFSARFLRADEFRLAHIFGDRMVLQQNEDIVIWGQGQPGQQVEVGMIKLGSEDSLTAPATTEVDEEGNWKVSLPPLTASNDQLILKATQGENIILLQDVLIGEVWICSGQSNMAYGLGTDTEWSYEQLAADSANVRYTQIKQFSTEPMEDLAAPAQWKDCTTDNPDLRRLSGVAYYFATRVNRLTDVPVGIVDNAIGGSMVEAWISREKLESIPESREFLDHYDFTVKDWPNEKLRRQQNWDDRAAKAKSEGKAEPRKPDLRPPASLRNAASACYNGLIHPIRQLSVRGALFFQGENNAMGTWNDYQVVFPEMIKEWREKFASPEMHFGIVSLYGFNPPQRDRAAESESLPPGAFFYAAIRDTHFRTHRTLDNTGLIVTADVGDSDNIHPHRKNVVGHRAARWALARVYDKPIAHMGPEYREFKIDGNKIKLFFDLDPLSNLEGAWHVSMPITRSGEYQGFVIAGEDQHFYPAEVKRNDQEKCLEVSSPHVNEPVAVRFGWANFPSTNMIGIDHLPAHPFRTDDWPLFEQPPQNNKLRQPWNKKLNEAKQAAERLAVERGLQEAIWKIDQIKKSLNQFARDEDSKIRNDEWFQSARQALESIQQGINGQESKDSDSID